MNGGYGRKTTCPGLPTTTYGFVNAYRWYICGSEVFQIYARGKTIGATITDQDTVALYCYSCNSYLKFTTSSVTMSKCLIQKSAGNSFPHVGAFDQCKGDSVEITIA